MYYAFICMRKKRNVKDVIFHVIINLCIKALINLVLG